MPKATRNSTRMTGTGTTVKVWHAALGAALVLSVAPALGTAQAADPCAPWTVRTVASGLGSLENLEPDGTGGMLLSASDRDAVERLTPDGRTTTVAADVDRPGGLRVRGRTLFANTGDGLQSGLLGTKDGTIQQIDLRTGRRTTYATGLIMPNGLVFAPNGDAFTSRDVPNGAITRIPAKDPAHPQLEWADLPDTNGLAVDPTGTWLYVATTFNLPANVYRVALRDPSRIELVASLFDIGVPKGLDDLTIDRRGILYVTANSGGQVIRLDPRTGDHCVIAGGMLLVSAVKFGRGPGWAANHLFTTGFDGTVHELTPPA